MHLINDWRMRILAGAEDQAAREAARHWRLLTSSMIAAGDCFSLQMALWLQNKDMAAKRTPWCTPGAATLQNWLLQF